MGRHATSWETFGQAFWLGQETGQNDVVEVDRRISIAEDERSGNRIDDERRGSVKTW